MKNRIQSFFGNEQFLLIIGIIFLLMGIAFFFFQEAPSVIKALGDLAPEFVSIGLTILIVDRIVERSQKQQKENEKKRELIQNMGSKSNDFALTAVRELRRKGWLRDGSLELKDFGWAELEKADLSRAEMTGAILRATKLRETNLAGTIFKNAFLTDALLDGANIALANFAGAEVSIEQLKSARFVVGTIMPDGTKLRDFGEQITGVDWEREPYPDGPTFEEWVAAQESKRENQA